MIFIRFTILIDCFVLTAQDANGAFAAYQAVRIMNANLLFLSKKKVLIVRRHFRSIVKTRKQRHMTFRALQESWHLNTNPGTCALHHTALCLGFYSER